MVPATRMIAMATSLDHSRDNATLVYSALASGLRPSARTAALSLGEGEGFILNK
jgi:hypothetical protein